jgi:preprotein translocase subunit Sss1
MGPFEWLIVAAVCVVGFVGYLIYLARSSR